MLIVPKVTKLISQTAPTDIHAESPSSGGVLRFTFGTGGAFVLRSGSGSSGSRGAIWIAGSFSDSTKAIGESWESGRVSPGGGMEMVFATLCGLSEIEIVSDVGLDLELILLFLTVSSAGR